MGKKFFNKNNQASKSGNFGPKQQTNFKAKFKPPGKNQAGKFGGNFGPKQQNNNYKAKFTPPGKNQAAKSGNFGPKQQNNYKAKFTPPGKNQSGGGGGFNKNKLGNGSGGFMKSPPKANKQNAGSLKRKLAEVKTPPTPQSTVKKEQKEKLKFDSDDSSDEDEELDDEEMGLSDEEMSEMEDEMESGEESDKEESMTLPPKANKQNAESLKRKLDEVKTPPTPQSTVKKEQKEKLKFDSDDSSDEDEELDDEEMGLSDEEMSEMEDEMESGEESDKEESMTSPQKANKQNAESLKRKLADLKTPPTPQSAVKKARLEGGGERAVKVEVEEKSTPKTKAEKKEAKKAEYEEHKQNIPKLSDEQTKAIAAEENRRRQERDKRTLFLRCETFTLMSPGDMKALHPDVVSVRNNHKLCWLIFPSESSAAKAHLALSKKDALSGKELFVDFCGANSKNPSKVKPDKNASRPINPLELLLTHLPKATTEEQLRVVFPTATRVRLPGANQGPGKIRKKTGGPSKMAFVKFETPAEAKKVFEKYGNQAMLKIGGELVDLYYSRMMN